MVGQVRVPCTVSWIKPRSSPYELIAWQLKNTESPRSAGLSWEVASRGRRMGREGGNGESVLELVCGRGPTLVGISKASCFGQGIHKGLCQGFLFPESSKDGGWKSPGREGLSGSKRKKERS